MTTFRGDQIFYKTAMDEYGSNTTFNSTSKDSNTMTRFPASATNGRCKVELLNNIIRYMYARPTNHQMVQPQVTY